GGSPSPNGPGSAPSPSSRRCRWAPASCGPTPPPWLRSRWSRPRSATGGTAVPPPLRHPSRDDCSRLAPRLDCGPVPISERQGMARDVTDATPIESRDQLVEALSSGGKPRDEWRVGTEHEKFGFYEADCSPVPYEGEHGIRRLLELMEGLLG